MLTGPESKRERKTRAPMGWDVGTWKRIRASMQPTTGPLQVHVWVGSLGWSRLTTSPCCSLPSAATGTDAGSAHAVTPHAHLPPRPSPRAIRAEQSPVPPALVRPKHPPQPAAALGSCWRWRWRGRLRCRGCGRCCSPSSPSRPASTFLPAVMHYAVMTRLSETNSLLLPHSGGAS